MNAIQVKKFGGPEVLETVALSRPESGPGQMLVKMSYVGVNFTDIYRREGNYAHSPTYPTPLPYVPGIEGAGIVEATGFNQH